MINASKEAKPLFKKVLITIAIFLLVDLGVFLFEYRKANLSGFAINSTIAEVYTEMPAFSKVFFVLQWAVFVVLLIYAAMKGRDLTDSEENLTELESMKKANHSKTDLDTLYFLLTRKKELKIATIAKVFEINKDLALEWGKTLEEGKLATIEYPGFGSPKLVLSKEEDIATPEPPSNYQTKGLNKTGERKLLKDMLDKETKKRGE